MLLLHGLNVTCRARFSACANVTRLAGAIDRNVTLRSVRRRRPSDVAVVAAINPGSVVVPLVVPAVQSPGNDQTDAVVQDIRRANPEPGAPSRVAEAERVIGDITVLLRRESG